MAPSKSDTIRWFEDIYRIDYRVLVSETKYAMIRYGLHGMMPEDIAQEVFLMMYAKREQLMSHPNPTGWLIVTMRNKVRTMSLKKGLLSVSFEFLLSLGTSVEAKLAMRAIVKEAERNMREEVIQRICATIGEENTNLLMELYVDRIPMAVLAKQYGITEGAMKLRVFRLRQYIQSNVKLWLMCVWSVTFLRFFR